MWTVERQCGLKMGTGGHLSVIWSGPPSVKEPHSCVHPPCTSASLPSCTPFTHQGLGKTVQCVSLLGYLSEVLSIRGPFLVVVPLSTVPNWIREFRRWTPNVSVVGLGIQPEGRCGGPGGMRVGR